MQDEIVLGSVGEGAAVVVAGADEVVEIGGPCTQT